MKWACWGNFTYIKYWQWVFFSSVNIIPNTLCHLNSPRYGNIMGRVHGQVMTWWHDDDWGGYQKSKGRNWILNVSDRQNTMDLKDKKCTLSNSEQGWLPLQQKLSTAIHIPLGKLAQKPSEKRKKKKQKQNKKSLEVNGTESCKTKWTRHEINHSTKKNCKKWTHSACLLTFVFIYKCSSRREEFRHTRKVYKINDIIVHETGKHDGIINLLKKNNHLMVEK